MNFASKFFANRTQTFPYIQINGSVTRETYLLFIIQYYLRRGYVAPHAFKHKKVGNCDKFKLGISCTSPYN